MMSITTDARRQTRPACARTSERPLLLGSAVLALALGAQAIAADWPQVLGPGRNGVYGGPPLSETWGGTGPRVVWRRQIGQGLSGPVVVQNRVILFHRVANTEVVEATLEFQQEANGAATAVRLRQGPIDALAPRK